MSNKKKILIIEDEAAFQKILSEFLGIEGFETLSALDGESGLEMARSQNPDLVLLDIILPKKDGYEVLAELKKDEKTKNIPVILLTNLESPEDVGKALQLGASTYLVKADYKLEEITQKIKELLKIN